MRLYVKRPAPVEEHQKGQHRHRQSRERNVRFEFAPFGGVAVDDASDDRIVDRVPEPGHERQNQHEHERQVQNLQIEVGDVSRHYGVHHALAERRDGIEPYLFFA